MTPSSSPRHNRIGNNSKTIDHSIVMDDSNEMPAATAAATIVSPSGVAAASSTSRRNKKNNTGALALPIITPAENTNNKEDDEKEESSTGARRALFPAASGKNKRKQRSLLVSPSPTSLASPSANKQAAEQQGGQPPSAKRRLIFGKYEVQDISDKFSPAVTDVYKIVRKLTGSIGGNGYCGPIYGELTMGSMQKMIDLMIAKTSFDKTSRFIDVGSGIGKPNLHVAQYPGVEFSCGVEMEHTRWSLGMTCLKAIMNEVVKESNQQQNDPKQQIQGNTMFLHKNITEAKTFDPFTHVYMFSIGFPPPLWVQLSEMWNKSLSPYLICYHSPKDIITAYGLNVDLIAQTQTSMHGSKEGHMGYIYKRSGNAKPFNRNKCDKAFQESWDLVQTGIQPLYDAVTQQVSETMGSERKTRSSSRSSSEREQRRSSSLN